MKEETRKRKERCEKADRRKNIEKIKQERQEAKKRFNTLEAAAYMGSSPSTLANWRWQGLGPTYHKIRGRVFYYQKDLDAFEVRIGN